MGRPVGVDAQTDIQPGSQGCEAPTGSTLHPAGPAASATRSIWWGGCLAMVASLLLWIGARDWRHGVAVVGLASTWLPWFLYDDRPIFFFYAITCLPFLVLSLALAMGHLIGTSDVPTPRRTFGVVVAGELHRAGADRLRVVLADLDRRPADQVGVGRPDLVPALDLTPPTGPGPIRP